MNLEFLEWQDNMYLDLKLKSFEWKKQSTQICDKISKILGVKYQFDFTGFHGGYSGGKDGLYIPIIRDFIWKFVNIPDIQDLIKKYFNTEEILQAHKAVWMKKDKIQQNGYWKLSDFTYDKSSENTMCDRLYIINMTFELFDKYLFSTIESDVDGIYSIMINNKNSKYSMFLKEKGSEYWKLNSQFFVFELLDPGESCKMCGYDANSMEREMKESCQGCGYDANSMEREMKEFIRMTLIIVCFFCNGVAPNDCYLSSSISSAFDYRQGHPCFLLYFILGKYDTPYVNDRSFTEQRVSKTVKKNLLFHEYREYDFYFGISRQLIIGIFNCIHGFHMLQDACPCDIKKIPPKNTNTIYKNSSIALVVIIVMGIIIFCYYLWKSWKINNNEIDVVKNSI